MRLEVDGQRFENFLSAWVEVGIDVLARAFSFTAATRGVDDIPFRPGQACAVWIDDDRVLTGWVERVEVAIAEGASEFTYTVSGHDRMVDVVDSHVDGLGEFGSTVAAAASAVLRFLGVDARVVDLSTSSARPFAAAGEVAAPEVGETAGDFLWGVASRRQVLLASSGDGDLVILNGDPEPIEARLVHRADGVGNNLLAMRLTSDHHKRFGLYRVVAQPNVAALSYEEITMEASEIAAVTAERVDPAIRATRRRTIAGEATYTARDAAARARWEANLARAEGFVYSATVESWRDAAGELWRVNTAPTVEDEFAGVSARLMVSHLRFELTERGPATTLVLRRLDAYASQAAHTEIERRAQVAADAAEASDELDLEGLVLE